MVREARIMITSEGGGRSFTRKRHEGRGTIFWDCGNVLYLDLGGDYTNVY